MLQTDLEEGPLASVSRPNVDWSPEQLRAIVQWAYQIGLYDAAKKIVSERDRREAEAEAAFADVHRLLEEKSQADK